MKADEIQTRTGLAAHEIALMRAMFQKQPQEFRRLRRSGAGAIGPSHARLWKSPQDRIGRKIVEFEIFFRGPFPIFDVRLIPKFPQPGFYFGVAVPFAQMIDKLKDQLRPFSIILWRIGPSGEDHPLRKIMAIRLRMSGKRLWHKAN